ncbi:ATPase [Vibrio astriarenae]|nr:ATPase [Vibrio sp. C7]
MNNSIKLRLEKWLAGGEFGWVFDNPVDELDFTRASNIGIDGTEFLDNDDVRTPISMYLLHRMEDIIDGRRFMYVMDEAWKWVNDAAFSEFVGNKQLTIRKQNGFGVFATQLPSSLLDSPQGAALVQSCSTEIYLPNPKAKEEEYRQGFGLTEKEFLTVKGMGEKSRLCLIKQGANSVVCSLGMPDMDDELTILSAGTKELPLFDDAIAEVGDTPSEWIPVFLEKVKAEKARSKT